MNFLDSGILCPTNADTTEINAIANGKLIGESIKIVSLDTPIAREYYRGTYRCDGNLELIHKAMPSGVPPHELNLKVIIF